MPNGVFNPGLLILLFIFIIIPIIIITIDQYAKVYLLNHDLLNNRTYLFKIDIFRQLIIGDLWQSLLLPLFVSQKLFLANKLR
jgi:hypothetical protein